MASTYRYTWLGIRAAAKLLGFVALTSACGPKSAGDDDDAAAAGKPAASGGSGGRSAAGGSAGKATTAGGAGGTTGATGGVSAGGTGAQAGSSGGKAGASHGNSKAEACVAYATAVCLRRAECNGTAPGDCYTSTQNCPDLTFSPGATRTIEGLFACAEAFASYPCEAVKNTGIAPCVTSGELEAGATCSFPSQCASLGCNTGGAKCGTCARVVGVGEDCSLPDVACDRALFCDKSSYRCVTSVDPVSVPDAGAPPPLGGPGAPCTVSTDCAAYSYCDFTTSAGTCVPLPSVGESCQAELACDGASYCDHGTLTCLALPAQGAACGIDAALDVAFWCADPLVCNGGTAAPTGTCVQPPASGAPCLLDPATSQPFLTSCETGLYCDQTLTPPTCVGNAMLGAACTAGIAKPCSDDASCLCTDDSCLTHVCAALRYAGERCDDLGARCHPAFTCTAGACAPLDSQGIFTACIPE